MEYDIFLPSMISLIFTLCVLSIIYGDNPLFRFAESTTIGAMAGHYILMALISIKGTLIVPISKGNIYLIFVFLLGIALFSRYTKWPWLARYPTAIMVGTGIGLSIRATIDAQIIQQIIGTMKPLNTQNLLTNIFNLFFVLGVLVSLSYFLFTIKLKGPLKIINKMGRLFLMMTFGAGAATYIIQMYNVLGTVAMSIIKDLQTIFG